MADKKILNISPLPLSYSSISTFESCPWRWYMEKTKQVQKRVHASALWGTDVHKAIEQALNGEPLDERYECYNDYISVLLEYKSKAKQYFIEQKLAVNNCWQQCDYDSDDAYLRGIVDFCIIRPDNVAYLIDHKTGNKRETKQLHLQAALLFANYNFVDKIIAMFYWMKYDDVTVYRFSRQNDYSDLCAYFDTVALSIVNDCAQGNYPKRSSPLCRFCSVLDCEFSVEAT